MTVLYLLALVFIGAVTWVTLHALPLFLVGGMGWDDLRSVLLHRAYRSFTFEGDVIPGVRPSLWTRLVIRTLSREDDARETLVMKAMTASRPRRRPLIVEVRVPRRRSSAAGQGCAMSRALVQARWFASPPWALRFAHDLLPALEGAAVSKTSSPHRVRTHAALFGSAGVQE